MAYCNVKFVLKEAKPKLVFIPETNCQPMLIEHINSGEQSVIIRHPNGVLFFDTQNGSITYGSDPDDMEENYTFIRYLSIEESVSFTGAT